MALSGVPPVFGVVPGRPTVAHAMLPAGDVADADATGNPITATAVRRMPPRTHRIVIIVNRQSMT
jgi:hypothetical protein